MPAWWQVTALNEIQYCWGDFLISPFFYHSIFYWITHMIIIRKTTWLSFLQFIWDQQQHLYFFCWLRIYFCPGDGSHSSALKFHLSFALIKVFRPLYSVVAADFTFLKWNDIFCNYRAQNSLFFISNPSFPASPFCSCSKLYFFRNGMILIELQRSKFIIFYLAYKFYGLSVL